MTTTLQILSRARELIEDRKGWTQKQWARDKYGVAVPVDSSAAVCFCSIGAIRKAALEQSLSEHAARNAQLALAETLGGQTVIRYNDSHTHAEVLDKFDKAIENLRDAKP